MNLTLTENYCLVCLLSHQWNVYSFHVERKFRRARLQRALASMAQKDCGVSDLGGGWFVFDAFTARRAMKKHPSLKAA